jgi:hypothetical protein
MQKDQAKASRRRRPDKTSVAKTNKPGKSYRHRQQTKPAPGKAKSHYMNQALTYWRFRKNRPTIQTNPLRYPKKPAATSDSKKKNWRRAKPCLSLKGSTCAPAPLATRTAP